MSKMGKTFLEGLKTPIAGLVEQANGLSYLPWPTAVALADRPALRVVSFEGGMPYLEFFDGLVVAVEGEGGQRIWLPVMDGRHRAIPANEANARDIGDAISRCRAKAVAMIHGVGMSLYAGYGEDIASFGRAMRIKPDSDLATVEPVINQKPGSAGSAYVDWAAAYTAAKVTDPNFGFRVLMFEDVDPDTGEVRSVPAKRVRGGWMVAVELTYKGRSHTEWLPIMGVMSVQTRKGVRKMDHQPLPNPDTHDWNRAVMRCLTRGIATLTGYGLSVYAGEDVESLHREPSGSRPAQTEPAPEALEAETNEPTEQVLSSILKRIGNITTLQSVEMAREQLTAKYKGTKALSEFLVALRAKETEIKEAELKVAS